MTYRLPFAMYWQCQVSGDMVGKFLLVSSLALTPVLSGCINPDRDQASIMAEEAYKTNNVEKYGAAIDILSKEIAGNPNDKHLHLERAYYYSLSGRKDESIRGISRAIEIDPDYANAYNNRCYDYYELKDYEKALADCNKAIALDPKYWQAYDSRGDLRLAMGDTDGACSDYKNAVKFDSDPDNDPFKYGEKHGKEWLSSEEGSLCRGASGSNG